MVLVSAAMAEACSNLVCLFMKTHLLALMQDNCLDFIVFSCASCLDTRAI